MLLVARNIWGLTPRLLIMLHIQKWLALGELVFIDVEMGECPGVTKRIAPGIRNP